MVDTFKPTRVAIIGAGAVGATTAFTLLLRHTANEIVLIDNKPNKAQGEALDIQHGLPFTGGGKVWAGDYADCKDADIIVVSAGVGQQPGETRQQLLSRNVAILKSIVGEITRQTDSGIMLIATNPVDVLSYMAWHESGWPSARVIGSGTVLDSARFRYQLGKELAVDPRSVHAHIVGEHGDTEVPIWSKTNVAGVPVSLPEATKESIYQQTRDAAYEIIQAKGFTSYAIGLALDRICAAILHNEHAVLNVSTLLQDYHGISDVYMGVPCVVGKGGIERIVDLPLEEVEVAGIQHSAEALRGRIQSVLPSSKG